MYLRTYVRTYEHRYVRSDVCAYICMYEHVYVCIYVYMYVPTYVPLYICMYVCMHACLYICICTCIYVLCMHACMFVFCMYAYIYVYRDSSVHLCMLSSFNDTIFCVSQSFLHPIFINSLLFVPTCTMGAVMLIIIMAIGVNISRTCIVKSRINVIMCTYTCVYVFMLNIYGDDV